MIEKRFYNTINILIFICYLLSWLLFDFLGEYFFHFHSLKYIIIVFHILFLLVTNIKKMISSPLRCTKFFEDYTTVVIMCTILYLITLCFQLINKGFKMYSIMEIIYIILPATYVFILINYSSKNIHKYLFMFLITASIGFIASYAPLLNLENILKIDFISSYSPFESDLAGVFLILFTYFYYKRNRALSIISWFFCFLSFKRLHIIYIIIFPVLASIFRKRKITKPNFFVVCFFALFFILSPFIIQFFVTDEFNLLFKSIFNITFNQFSMGRYELIRYVLNNNYTNYGLGTISNQIFIGTAEANLHCDLLRIYLETTFVGLIALIVTFIKISKRNIYTFMLTIFYLFVMFSSHMLTNFLSVFLIFLVIASINNDNKKKL